MAGTTNKGQVENELFVIVFCRDGVLQEVKTCSWYLCVLEPTKADTDGLVECQSIHVYLVRMACEAHVKLLYLDCTGSGAKLIILNLHARMLFPVVASMTLIICY